MVDSSGGGGATKPVVLGLTLPYSSVEEFIQKGCGSLTAGGIYIRATPPAVGTLVHLDLRIRNGERVLQCLGTVAFTTGDGGLGHPGMGIKFVQLDEASKALVHKACTGRPGADAPHPPLPHGVGQAHGGEAAPPPATVFAAHYERPTAPASAPAEPDVNAMRLSGSFRVQAPIDNPLSRVKPVIGTPKGPIIGIDLGTTYSCAACVKGGKPYVIPSREGHNTIPSVVAVNNRNKLLIGHRALQQMVISPKETVFGGKRLVGRPFTSPIIDQVKARFFYDIVEGPKGEAAVRMGGQLWSLQEISALILLEAKELAMAHLGTNVERAVITVPAYYNDNQRQAVRQAGALAGLHVERIINEPTAAALAFGWGRQLKKTILVYDLGGGTFDVSLLRLQDNVYEVISTGGDTFLGGVDFDMQIVDHLMLEFQLASGKPFSGDPVAKQRLMEAAERAKRLLSEQAETRIQLPFLQLVDNKPCDLDVTLTREQLNQLCVRLVDRTLEVCTEVLAAQNLKPQDVEEVLFVGGMSRMPLVAQKVEQYFGKAPSHGVHPDEAVGIGAALFAHSLGLEEGVVLIDVLPMSIGIGLPGGRLKKIVERNTPLPHAREYQLSTVRDDQEEMELVIFQGDSDLIGAAEYLGTVKLAPLPKGPKGAVKMAVNFALSAECLLTVTARELSKGLRIQTTLSTRDTPEVVRHKLNPAASPSQPPPSAPKPTAPSQPPRPSAAQPTAPSKPPAPAVAAAAASALQPPPEAAPPPPEEPPAAPRKPPAYRKSWFERMKEKLFGKSA